ncbi:hypothetical protein GGQ68_001663 [Sagittula marina]|uniref:Uncharacterized protein n=1 Tax=Sagittula marina TaxID=943940 RepID=A0A7W6DUA7_9RHOB|nr:hypothetical protein [Sagittula marina]
MQLDIQAMGAFRAFENGSKESAIGMEKNKTLDFFWVVHGGRCRLQQASNASTA